MKKDLGAIFLVSGTTVGAGMLALPSITVNLGFGLTALCFLAIYGIMLLSAKYLVKLVLHFDQPHNFVGLAEKTLKKKGAAICWILYLLLMYALLAAYISASASIISSYFGYLPETILILLLPILFSFFMLFGLKSIDFTNRIFVFILSLSFIALLILLAINPDNSINLKTSFNDLPKALPVIITAFGYHIIIPTISVYLDRSYKRIIRSIFWGSLIPLIIYIIWQVLVSLNLSIQDLEMSLKNDIPLTELLAKKSVYFSYFSKIFSYFAIITSFIGVALSLYDFLKDSLPAQKILKTKQILFALTFLPPIVYIFYFKKAFFVALDHAGILVSLLLILFPALMYQKIKSKKRAGVILLAISAFAIIVIDLFQKIIIQ